MNGEDCSQDSPRAGQAPVYGQPRGGDTGAMTALMVPANAREALGMLESAMGFLADADAALMARGSPQIGRASCRERVS